MRNRTIVSTLLSASFIIACGTQTGPAGPIGMQGQQGSQGVAGEAGAMGIPGQQGSTGQTGNMGLQGEVGLQGSTGLQGEAGPMGSQGIQGSTGPQAPMIMFVDAGSDAGYCNNPNGTYNVVYTTPDGGDCGPVLNYPPLLATGQFDLLWLGERLELSASDCDLTQSIENITSNNCTASLTALCYGFGFILEEQIIVNANTDGTFTGTVELQEVDNSSNILCGGEYSVSITENDQ